MAGGRDARGAARDQPVEGLLSRDPLKVMYLKKHKTECACVYGCVCVCVCLTFNVSSLVIPK